VPAAPVDPDSGLILIGLSHRSAALALRERLYLEARDLARLEAEVRGAGVDGAIVVSTCDRLEILAVDADPAAALDRLEGLLADWAQVAREELRAQSYRHAGRHALRHLFAVAASLDSQVVGEPQVLGQLKDCHRRAVEAGAVGPALDAVMAAAYQAAKRIRRETPLARQPVTITASAVQLVRSLHGDLGGQVGLLAGLGEMGELMAAEFQEAGLGRLVVGHANGARAEAAAQRLGCNLVAWEALADALAGADLVISAAGSGHYCFSAAQVRAALKRRRQKPIFMIDCAVPPDLDPAIDGLEGAFAYTLADLETVAWRGRAKRETGAAEAWRILEQELEAFAQRRAQRAAAPAVQQLRGRFEEIRREILAGGAGDAEQATRQLVNRLLHDPSEALRRAAADGGLAGDLERLLRRLFRIDVAADRDPGDQGSEDDGPGGERNER